MRHTKQEQQGKDANKTKTKEKERTNTIENKLKAIQKRVQIDENLIDLTRREREIYLQTIN